MPDPLISPLRRAATIAPYTDAEQSLRDNAFASPFKRSLLRAVNTDIAGAHQQELLEAQVRGDAAAERAAAYNLRDSATRMQLPSVGPTTWADARESGNYGDYIANTLGSAAGSMVKPLLGSAAGSVMGGPLGAAAGAFGGSYSAIRNAELVGYENDRQLASMTPQQKLDLSQRSSALQAIPDAILPTYLGVGGRLPGALARIPTPLRIAGEVGAEAGTEGLQDYISQTQAQNVFPDRQLDWDSVKENAIAGAVAGGGFGVLGRHQVAEDAQAPSLSGATLPPEAAAPQLPTPDPVTPAPQAPPGQFEELFNSTKERFAPKAQEAYGKASDYVSDIIGRMGEAAKTAQSPSDFLRQVFSGSAEDAAAADLRPDTEDPGVMNSADPAAALQQRDAQRQERAAFFAEELLNDPATPDAVREQVASFGGDFSDPEARAFVARTLVAQRAGEKLVHTVNDLIDLSKDFGGRAAEVGTDLAAKARGMIDKGMAAATDRIMKKNLQDATPAEQATFNKLVFDSLTDEAKASPAVRQRLPELANAMLAFAARTGDLTKADLKTLSRMQDGLAMFRDPEQLAAKLTEYAGLPRTEDSFLSRVKRVTNAQQDILQPNSFLYSSLSEDAKDMLSQPQLRRLARLVDDFTLSDSSKAQGDKVLAGLTAAFGSKEAAQSVLDYYQQQNRADLRFDPTRPTGDAYEGTDDVAEFGTLPERDAPEQDTYYADPKSMRPFYEGREGRLSTEGGTRRRVRDIEAFMDRMQGRGVELRSQRYGDFLKERGEDSAEAVKRIRKDLEKRIAEAAPRKGEAAEYAEGRKKNRQYLEEQLLALNLIEKADGPEAAANLFSVARAVGERSELGITDAQLAESDTLLRRTLNPKKPPPGMDWAQAKKHNRDIEKTKIVFNRRDGAQPLALSAESLWKAYAKGQPAGRSVRQLFADAVSAVLNRPDIADLASGLDGVLIDRASGTYADPQMSDDVRAAKKELAHEYEARLSEAKSRVEEAASEIEDARDEGPADSALVERIEEAADELQREADAGRITATELRDKAKAMPWVDDAPSPEAIELRARAAWEHDISRVYAEGARDLREIATEVRSELERVEGGERGAAAKVRNYDESTGAALHPDDKPSAAKPKGLGKRLDAALLANPELLAVLDARGQPKDKAMTESRMRENLFEAYAAVKTPALKARLEGLRAKYQEAKNASNVGTPAAREAAKQEAAALKEIGQMVRWILEQREGGRTDTESAPGTWTPGDAARGAEALSTFRSKVGSSKVGAKRGRPGKNWGDKDAVKAEILRLRGKDVKVKVEKLVMQLGGSGQYTYDPATGERLIEVAVNASSTVGTARHEAMHDLFRFLSENDATRSVAKDLRDATSAPHVIRQLRDLLKDHKPALEQLNDPEERAAYAYQFWAEGLLQIGPTGTGVFNTIRQFIKDLFGVVTAGQRGEDLLRAFHDGKFADPSIVQEVLQDINDSSGDRVSNKLSRATPALTRALNSLLSVAPERLRRFENDYLNELADKFQPEKGTGFVQNRSQQEGIWTNRLGGILRGTTAVERREAIDQLQAMKPTSKLAKELAKFNEDIYEYMRDAGVQSWDSAAKKFVPLRKVQGYFTRSWDPDAIARNRSEFEALLRTEGSVSAANAAALAENLVRGSEQRPKPKESPVDLGFMPYAPHTSERVLTFINSGNADKFAKFQRKDLADIMMSYVRGSTHRAEYAREFGNNGEKIVDLVNRSGIKDTKELGEISNAVQALEGSLDPDNWSVQTKEAMSAVLTLQNVTLLPLALASQMIDPIVMAARTGDIKDAGAAYVTALKRLKNTITKSKNKVPGEELAEILGVVSEDSTLQAMAMAYGTTRMSKRMENINRVFFKYNGMQGWNNSMRIAATAAGEKYLLAHRKDANALAELGLEPKDIKSVGGKLDVSSPKVQQAMFQFVDQAVLRPSAANRPVWMSDPRFLLVAHLKQFTFAMHNVVLKRANRELQNDNPKPWAMLMLAMPVILAADMAKFALTGGTPTSWGFKDYVMHAVERSGLLGIGDFGAQAMGRVGSGGTPVEGLLGPTFENLMVLLRWIGGDSRTDFGDVLDRSVPGARFI